MTCKRWLNIYTTVMHQSFLTTSSESSLLPHSVYWLRRCFSNIVEELGPITAEHLHLNVQLEHMLITLFVQHSSISSKGEIITDQSTATTLIILMNYVWVKRTWLKEYNTPSTSNRNHILWKAWYKNTEAALSCKFIQSLVHRQKGEKNSYDRSWQIVQNTPKQVKRNQISHLVGWYM